MTAYTARPLTTNALYQAINQTAHGFAVGEVIINAALVGPPTYVAARASTVSFSFGIMMVSAIIDADNFFATQAGHVANMTYQAPYTVGGSYYLSPTNFGQITLTPPNSAGQIYLPCFKADTTTSGFFFGGMGIQISSGVNQWVQTAIDVNPMVPRTGYITVANPVNLTLPLTAALGDTIRITNIFGNFNVLQQANQEIAFGDKLTTIGVGGSIATTNLGDTVELICAGVTAGESRTWQAISSIGNFTIV